MIWDSSKIPDHSLLLSKLDLPEYVQNKNKIGEIHKSHEQKLPRLDYRNLPTEFMNNQNFIINLNVILENIRSNMKTQRDIDDIYTKFVSLLHNEINSIILLKKMKFKSGKEFWNDILETHWKNMRQKETLFKKSKYKKDKQILWISFKHAQSQFNKKFKFFKYQYEKTKMIEFETLNINNPIEFWNKIKQLGPYKKNSIPMEVIKENGILVTDSDSVLSIWQSEFRKLYNLDVTENFDHSFYKLVTHSLKCKQELMNDPMYISESILNMNISISEVTRLVKKAKSGKAVGVDKIPYEILKHKNIEQLLKMFFLLCFDTGKIPAQWSKAVIVPIAKSGNKDPRMPLNYRGISLLCNTAKLYSSLINNRLVKFFEHKIKLCDEQNGFRANRSCEEYIFSLTTIIRKNLSVNQDIFAAFIDLQKAFDFVNRKLLLFKLIKNEIQGKIFFAIKSMLEHT